MGLLLENLIKASKIFKVTMHIVNEHISILHLHKQKRMLGAGDESTWIPEGRGESLPQHICNSSCVTLVVKLEPNRFLIHYTALWNPGSH